MIRLFVFALALVLGTAGAAFAGKQDFTLVNATGYPIKRVFVAPSSSDDWEEDVLGRDIMDDGQSVELTFDRKESTCRWDMKVVYTDGDVSTWSGLNLCSISKVTLKWNKSSGVTTAVVE